MKKKIEKDRKKPEAESIRFFPGVTRHPPSFFRQLCVYLIRRLNWSIDWWRSINWIRWVKRPFTCIVINTSDGDEKSVAKLFGLKFTQFSVSSSLQYDSAIPLVTRWISEWKTFIPNLQDFKGTFLVNQQWHKRTRKGTRKKTSSPRTDIETSSLSLWHPHPYWSAFWPCPSSLFVALYDGKPIWLGIYSSMSQPNEKISFNNMPTRLGCQREGSPRNI